LKKTVWGGSAMMEAFIAAARFGLGARPGELGHIGRDARAYLEDQLHRPPEIGAGLQNSAAGLKDLFAYQLDKNAKALADPEKLKALRQGLIAIYRAEILARLKAAVTSEASFQERLVRFWANHFAVSMQNKLVVAPVAGAYVREAIRPNIMGSFHDLLLAVESHPAMLLYLDNALSIGPNSFGGERSGRGLNENLAREILELHTLGVDGGYSQADVTSFAKVLTGWTVARGARIPGEPGTFQFAGFIHEPGVQTVMGKIYGQDGMDQGEAVLRDLARHPATHRHLAVKLGRHFIADDPPKDAVARIAASFGSRDGDLKAVYRALIAEQAAWQPPLVKIKTPEEFLISTLRGFALEDVEHYKLIEALTLLGERPFFAPSPQGWPDDAASWTGPDSIKTRLEYANQVGEKLASSADPIQLADTTLGDAISLRTKEAIGRAASPAQGLTLLLMSPEFQRR
jgi:uncharacterized protein (DUF1800 family)